jgi:hypothetical protein
MMLMMQVVIQAQTLTPDDHTAPHWCLTRKP